MSKHAQSTCDRPHGPIHLAPWAKDATVWQSTERCFEHLGQIISLWVQTENYSDL